MEAFGASPEQIAEAVAAIAPQTAPVAFQIHFANRVAVLLFLALATQWKWIALSAMSKAAVFRSGLDYGVIEAVARLKGLVLGEGDFDRLQIMEAAALKAWTEAAR